MFFYKYIVLVLFFISINCFICFVLKMDEFIKEFDIIKIPFAMDYIERVNEKDRIKQANMRFNKYYSSTLELQRTPKVRFTV